MMKKLILLATIILTSIQLFANDKEFTQGYIILEKGDTIQGFIKKKSWRKNPNSIVFTSPILNNDSIEYGLEELKGFGVSDNIFVKQKVKIDTSPNKIDDLTITPVFSFKEENVFLQVLTKGKATLYYLNELSGRIHYFIESPTLELQELISIMYYRKITTNGITKNYIGHSIEYKTQLKDALVGCTDLNDKDFDIELKEKAVYKLINEYNKCVTPMDYYSKEIEKWEVLPYVLAGLNIAKIKFSSDYYGWAHLVNADFNSTNFTANIGLKFNFPKYEKRLAIYTDLGYNIYSFKASGIEQNPALGATNYDYLIDFSQLTLNYGLSYHFLKEKNSPFIKVGLSSNFILNMYTERKISSYSNSTYLINDTKSYMWGLNFGAGLNFSKISLLYQFEVATGISNYINLSNKVLTNYIMIGYTFIKKK